MTQLGMLLKSRSVNNSAVSRKTGIRASRLSKLSNNPDAQLTARELHLIALAISADPGDLMAEIYRGLVLKNDDETSGYKKNE